MAMDPLVARYVHACAQRARRVRTGREVRDWLHARGFDDDTIRANLIGADPGRDDDATRSRASPTAPAIAATFPALDPAGNLTYVQARYLDPDSRRPQVRQPRRRPRPAPRLAFPDAERRPCAATRCSCAKACPTP